ncbi:MAG: ArsR family transcriptional regulator [Muribaculaceae bacterium]|nr:ArsR family transcriptional regulator [Muribaculaceae bacterium]
MDKVLLNPAELELIEAIRNLRLAYPNGYEELLWYAQQLFDKLVEMPPEDE